MSESGSQLPADYASLLAKVKERVRAARYAALKAVNKELLLLDPVLLSPRAQYSCS